MKINLKKTLILVLSITSLSIFASDNTLDMGNIINLKQLSNKLILTVNYPGPWGNSSICGIKFVTTKRIIRTERLSNLRKAIKVEDGYVGAGSSQLKELRGSISGGFGATLSYGLYSTGLYMTNIVISTRSGRSLKEVIQRTLGLNKAIGIGVVSTKCIE